MFLIVAAGGGCFSCYLLYVIKFVLKDFCIVCTSFHIANFTMLILAVLEYRDPEVRVKGQKGSGSKTKPVKRKSAKAD